MSRPPWRGRRRVFRDGRRSRLLARIDRLSLPAEPTSAERRLGRVLRPAPVAVAGAALLALAVVLVMLDGTLGGPLAGALASASTASAWMLVWFGVAANTLEEARRPPAVEVSARGILVGGRFLSWDEVDEVTDDGQALTVVDRRGRPARTPRLRSAERSVLAAVAVRKLAARGEPAVPAELTALRARA